MSNLTSRCPLPFLDEAMFPSEGGYILGRICDPVPDTNISCCIPCPSAQYLYADTFYGLSRIPGFIAIVSAVICVFMLLSYAVLPPDITKRNHMNVCLFLSALLLQLGLAIPVVVRPEQCMNSITPNDMSNSMTCACTGTLIVFGGCAVHMWIFARVITMHLQIVWDVNTADRFSDAFFWTSNIFAWGLTILFTSLCLGITGVSFRFGDYCHVNNHKGVSTIWAPLLSLAVVSICLQFATFGYCVKIYVQNLFVSASDGASATDSHFLDSRADLARMLYRRLKNVLAIQWRSLVLAVQVIIDVVYFSAVFIDLDNRSAIIMKNPSITYPWIACMIMKPKDECISLADSFRPNGEVLIAILGLLAVIGIEAFLLYATPQLLTGWWHLLLSLSKKGRGRSSNVEDGDGGAERKLTLTNPMVLSPDKEKSHVEADSASSSGGVAFSFNSGQDWICPRWGNAIRPVVGAPVDQDTASDSEMLRE